MKSRRAVLLSCLAVALAVVAAPVIAEELIGYITKVDVDGKKLTVVAKETDKESEITVNDDTEVITPKGDKRKVDLEKLSKGVEKAKEKGSKGVNVKITHDKNVASKIEFQKKAAPKKDQ